MVCLTSTYGMLYIPAQMRTEDAVRHFSTKAEVARALGITRASLTDWGELVPALRAAQLERITAGHLKFDPNEYLGRPGGRAARAANPSAVSSGDAAVPAVRPARPASRKRVSSRQ